MLHPEDAAGAKVADLARRGRMRDYAATADLLEHYKPGELIGFARRLDPPWGARTSRASPTVWTGLPRSRSPTPA